MKQLILHPTDISQWHALVNEAQAATQLMLTENTESYLVFLLMRFSHGPKLIESVIALDFLESMHRPKTLQMEVLRDVGDKSLLFAGYFRGLPRSAMSVSNIFLKWDKQPTSLLVSWRESIRRICMCNLASNSLPCNTCYRPCVGNVSS